MLDKLRVRVGDKWYLVEIEDINQSPVRTFVNGELIEVFLEKVSEYEVTVESSTSVIENDLDESLSAEDQSSKAPSAVKVFQSPMPGIVISLAVSEGDQVITGDEICVLEAMKMQQTLRSDWSGIVKSVRVSPGDQILGGAVILELE
mgnify:CR=1 FL=1